MSLMELRAEAYISLPVISAARALRRLHLGGRAVSHGDRAAQWCGEQPVFTNAASLALRRLARGAFLNLP